MKRKYYTTWKQLEESDVELSQNQAEVAQKIAHKLGIGKMSPLGNGTQGYAYYIPGNKALKITKDKSEAVESYKIKGKNLKHLAKVYDVFVLKGKFEGLYVITSELLDFTDDITDGEKLVDDILMQEYGFPFESMADKYHLGKIGPDFIKQVTSVIKTNLEPYKAKTALWFLNQMIGVIEDLKANNIESTDWYIHNLGVKKNGNLAMFDLGYGDDNLSKDVEDIDLNEELTEEAMMEFLSADEYPDFLDGQNNPFMYGKAYPPVMNMNAAGLSEEEISQEELSIKDLPLKHSNVFHDYVFDKTEAEIREIAPTINLDMNPHALVLYIEKNNPDLFDSFAEWLSEKGYK